MKKFLLVVLNKLINNGVGTFVSYSKYSSSRFFLGFNAFESSLSKPDDAPGLHYNKQNSRKKIIIECIHFNPKHHHPSFKLFKFSTNFPIRSM